MPSYLQKVWWIQFAPFHSSFTWSMLELQTEVWTRPQLVFHSAPPSISIQLFGRGHEIRTSKCKILPGGNCQWQFPLTRNQTHWLLLNWTQSLLGGGQNNWTCTRISGRYVSHLIYFRSRSGGTTSTMGTGNSLSEAFFHLLSRFWNLGKNPAILNFWTLYFSHLSICNQISKSEQRF